MNIAVFLDRDGVLNEAIVRDGRPYPPRSLSEFAIVPDARVVLDELHDAGYRLIVATNQPDVARGTATREQVAELNQHLRSCLPVDAIEVCEHDDADACGCRKPEPGLLLRAAERDVIDLTRSFMIGDRWRDIEAGRRAGCRTVLIGNGYGERFISQPDVAVRNLGEAARWIVSNH